MITLMIWIVVVMIVLMVIGLIVSKAHKSKLDQAQLNYNKYYRINYHSTTGTGSRR